LGSGLSRAWLQRLLVLPALIYMFPIYLASLCVLVVFTFFQYVPGGPILTPSFTLANYARLLDP
jgi:ABC-type spermidine/putrescine transport system permease subunit I